MQLPDRFTERTRDILKEEFDDFLKSLETNSPVSIRVNNKTEIVPSTETVIWNKNGYYLPERPLFTADPLFHAGAYYVQEASSMFLAEVAKQFFSDAETVLDLCAAPGGKSTSLLQELPENSLLVCNEIVRSRAYILAENIAKWGNPNVIVTNNKPEDFSKATDFFDVIVVDAPCSGEGMFRKDPGAIDEWSIENVTLCAQRQKDIIGHIWESLKPGGILVYSTCTYNREENEENIQWICENFDAEKQDVRIPENSGIVTSDAGYRFYPHRVKGEGFFISVIKKSEESTFSKKIKNYGNKGIKFVKEKNDLTSSLKEPEKFSFFIDENYLRAFPIDRFDDYYFVFKSLNFMSGGLTLAEIKGRDYIPAAELALSKELDINNVVSYDSNKDEAIRFLRKDAIVLDTDQRNYVLICYKGLALGWVKNLGNRCNNLYPQNWRIRMQL